MGYVEIYSINYQSFFETANLNAVVLLIYSCFAATTQHEAKGEGFRVL